MSRFNIKDIEEDVPNVERFSSKRKQNHTRRDRQENTEAVKKGKSIRSFVRESKGHGYSRD